MKTPAKKTPRKRRPRIAVVGLGLIGGSFYKAAAKAGYDATGLHHGDRDGAGDADLVLVSLPPQATVPWIRAHAGEFKRGAVVIDACGVKRPVCRAVAKITKKKWLFVGGHPMAGKEKSGFENSSETLFAGASMVLTPDSAFPARRLSALKRFFASLGFARTIVTTPERHDATIAFTSQLGHVIAAAYAQDPAMDGSVGFTAGSFANMTRIATADPDVWCALYSANRDALLKAIDGFAARLAAFRKALAEKDLDAVKAFIAAGARAKESEIRRRGAIAKRSRPCRKD